GGARRPPFAGVEAESPQDVVARVEGDAARPGGRLLTLGAQDASYVDLDDPTYLDWPYVRRIGDVIDAVRPADVLHLGGGAGTLARYVEATLPRSRQEVVEIDPVVVALAREHLGLRSHPRLRVRVGDAAVLLPKRPDATLDLVVCDAFDPLGTIPPALVTAEFARECARVLRPGGVHVVNVVDTRGLPLAREHAATFASAFADVAVVVPRAILRHRAGGNVLLLASSARLPLDTLRTAAASSPDREEVHAWPLP
ncbi:MAG TPA: fused MFS/spermidine synthase, partial [Solirubrobacteraceae bacterium]|nr:fused MFS/spermidine synthase [Solirubrobacteraceae bacterium]